MRFFDRFRRKPAVPAQDALGETAIRSENWAVAEKAVDQLTDQSVIARVAVDAREELARIAAIKKLDDMELLRRIAESDREELVRSAATRRLTRLTPASEEELRRIRSASGRNEGLALRCGGCGAQSPVLLDVVVDKNGNRGILCTVCQTEYLPLLRSGSDRRFWACSSCRFRILAGTKIDASVDDDGRCPNCHSDVHLTLVNLSADHPVARGVIGEPVE